MLLKLKTKTAWIFYHAWLIKLNIRTTYFYSKRSVGLRAQMKAECGVYLQLDLRWKKHAQQAQKLQEQPGTTGQGCLALQIETHLLSTTIKDPGLQRCMAPWSSFRFRCHAEKHHSCRSPRRKECRAPLLSRAYFVWVWQDLGLSRKAASDSLLLSPEALSQETWDVCVLDPKPLQ